jgi:hypothetical protein
MRVLQFGIDLSALAVVSHISSKGTFVIHSHNFHYTSQYELGITLSYIQRITNVNIVPKAIYKTNKSVNTSDTTQTC